jgi:hypothetical protein
MHAYNQRPFLYLSFILGKISLDENFGCERPTIVAIEKTSSHIGTTMASVQQSCRARCTTVHARSTPVCKETMRFNKNPYD